MSAALLKDHASIEASAKGVYTITFGDVAENGVGMEKLGIMAARGISSAELIEAEKLFASKGCKTELIDLTKYFTEADLKYFKSAGKPPSVKNSQLPDKMSDIQAHLLIIRKGANAILGDEGADMLKLEQQRINYDTRKIGMYGKQVNAQARYNVCFDNYNQDIDLDAKKGTVVDFRMLPILNTVKEKLPEYIPYLKEVGLRAEGNYYYKKTCGIGWHGDKERRVVLAIRLGESMSLNYHWYHGCQQVGTMATFTLNHGDLYIMSDKAVGYDAGSRCKLTLRHSAGEFAGKDF